VRRRGKVLMCAFNLLFKIRSKNFPISLKRHIGLALWELTSNFGIKIIIDLFHALGIFPFFKHNEENSARQSTIQLGTHFQIVKDSPSGPGAGQPPLLLPRMTSPTSSVVTRWTGSNSFQPHHAISGSWTSPNGNKSSGSLSTITLKRLR